MENVVIVAAGRTAIGAFNGAFAGLPATSLGAQVISTLLARTGISPAAVDEVILGQVLTAGAGQNPARQTAIRAGIPDSVPSMTINKVCGSGLKAVHLAAQAIRSGDAEIVVAGGQENMSLAPHLLPGSRNGAKMGDWALKDSMIVDGLWDAFNDVHMGIQRRTSSGSRQFLERSRTGSQLALSSRQKLRRRPGGFGRRSCLSAFLSERVSRR